MECHFQGKIGSVNCLKQLWSLSQQDITAIANAHLQFSKLTLMLMPLVKSFCCLFDMVDSQETGKCTMFSESPESHCTARRRSGKA